MKELEILPLLTYESDDLSKSTYKDIQGLLEATSPIKYARDRLIHDQILEYGVGSNSDLVEELFDNVEQPENEGIFHAPFFFER